MRYIPLLESQPPADWLQKAATATVELEAEEDAVKRQLLIKKKAAVWGELKDWLLSLSNQKCWFSEAKDCFQHWDVEHFRPKAKAKNLDKTERDGYWWLAFAWKNLRACGRVGNAKKGTFFPLGSNYCATSANRDTDDEVPYLLDPVVKSDCALLSFNQIGEAIPAPGADSWSEKRVKVSVEQYELDFEKLILQRKLIWDTCKTMINEIQNLMQDQAAQPGAAKKARIEERMRELAKLADRHSVCSSAAIACLQKSEIGWAVRLSAEAA
jgi:hypothetical protein